MTSALAPVEQASHERPFGQRLPKALDFRIAGTQGEPRINRAGKDRLVED